MPSFADARAEHAARVPQPRAGRRLPLPFAHKKAPNAIRTDAAAVAGRAELLRARPPAPRGRRHHRRRRCRTSVEQLFDNLGDKNFVRANALTGERLLRNADPTQVVYSLMLFERTPQGNLLRVNADNLERPFDINGGVKLDLGSTAKMRTTGALPRESWRMLHDELQPREDHDSSTALAQGQTVTDPLTAWAAETLAATARHRPRRPFCRSRSTASTRPTPARVFFTGGGVHIVQQLHQGRTTAHPADARRRCGTSNNLVFVTPRCATSCATTSARLDYDAERAAQRSAAIPSAQRMRRRARRRRSAPGALSAHLSRATSGLTPDAAIASLLGSRATIAAPARRCSSPPGRSGTTPAQLGRLAASHASRQGATPDDRAAPDARVRRLAL